MLALFAQAASETQAVSDAVHITLFICFMGVLACAYLLPTIVAFMRNHHNAFPIFLVNLLLGLTGVFWIVALVWAFTNPPPAPRYYR